MNQFTFQGCFLRLSANSDSHCFGCVLSLDFKVFYFIAITRDQLFKMQNKVLENKITAWERC